MECEVPPWSHPKRNFVAQVATRINKENFAAVSLPKKNIIIKNHASQQPSVSFREVHSFWNATSASTHAAPPAKKNIVIIKKSAPQQPMGNKSPSVLRELHSYGNTQSSIPPDSLSSTHAAPPAKKNIVIIKKSAPQQPMGNKSPSVLRELHSYGNTQSSIPPDSLSSTHAAPPAKKNIVIIKKSAPQQPMGNKSPSVLRELHSYGNTQSSIPPDSLSSTHAAPPAKKNIVIIKKSAPQQPMGNKSPSVLRELHSYGNTQSSIPPDSLSSTHAAPPAKKNIVIIKKSAPQQPMGNKSPSVLGELHSYGNTQSSIPPNSLSSTHAAPPAKKNIVIIKKSAPQQPMGNKSPSVLGELHSYGNTQSSIPPDSLSSTHAAPPAKKNIVIIKNSYGNTQSSFPSDSSSSTYASSLQPSINHQPVQTYRPSLKAPVIAPCIAASQRKQASALLHHRCQPENPPSSEGQLQLPEEPKLQLLKEPKDSLKSSVIDTDINNPVLMSLLPPGYEYKLESIEIPDDNNLHITANVRAKITSKEAALKWIRDYEDYTLTNLRTDFKQENSSRIVYKQRFRCHHNTKASLPSSKTKTPHEKHVNCPAVVIITVKQPNMPRSLDVFLREYPTVIYLKHVHNHNIKCADALRFRRPYPEMEERFISMYHRGHSPSSALESLKHELQEEYGAEYFKVSADRAKCPSVHWAYNVYYRNFGQVYGAPSGPEMLLSLKKFINEYNESQKSECAAFEEFNGELLIAICTPFMKRVLTKLRSSGEIMFVDSSGCMDNQNSRVFLLLFPSVAGALPGGVLILSSERETCLTRALNLYLTLIPEESFVGRGRSLGPSIIMSDDSAAERNAFKSVFASAILLLCLFHVLQALWRYVWDGKHKVEKEDRPAIFYQFKDCAYAKSSEDFGFLYDKMLEDPIVQQYPVLLDHLRKVRGRAPEWALHQRRGLLTRGHVTNNLSEANIKVIKTILLNRTKAFNCVQLFDFLTAKYDSYFERRISAVINNRVENHSSSRYFVPESKLKPLSCQKISTDVYLVKNSEKGTEYTVDMDLELCSCEAGVGGALCKHLYSVVKTYHLSCSQVLPYADPAAKLNLYHIMSGGETDESFFHSFKQVLKTGAPENAKSSDEMEPMELIDDEPIELMDDEPMKLMDDDPMKLMDDDCLQAVDKVTSDNSNCRKKLQDMVDLLESKADSNPTVALCLQKFLEKMFNECTTDSALEHSLCTFNRYRGPKPTAKNSPKRPINVKRCGNMPVNLLSVRRRKLPISGRNSAITGRTPKAFRADNQGNQQQASVIPPSRRSKAPQNLAACVSANVALGKNCGRKMK